MLSIVYDKGCHIPGSKNIEGKGTGQKIQKKNPFHPVVILHCTGIEVDVYRSTAAVYDIFRIVLLFNWLFSGELFCDEKNIFNPAHIHQFHRWVGNSALFYFKYLCIKGK